MFKKLAVCLLTLLAAFSCTQCGQTPTQVTNQFQYQDDGLAKPKVAMVPIYDHSGAKLPWDLSREFTKAVEEKIFLAGHFYLTSDFDLLTLHQLPLNDINPFIDDIEWLGEVDTGTEFLIFLELIEHQLGPSQEKTGLGLFQSQALSISMRVKVIDLRYRKPQVILQEIVHETSSIPWKVLSFNYQRDGWGKTAFALSPIGLAHGKIVKRVVKQIEDYILLAKRH